MSADSRVEYEYNPHVHVPDVAAYVEAAARASQQARERIEGIYDVAYGDEPRMTCDIFPAGPDAPVHVFVHGGYWRGRDKADYSFMAPAFLDAGVTLVLPTYGLCPTVDLATIVRQIADFLGWLPERIGDYGGDPQRITASAHSAGAHLVAMAHAADRQPPARRGGVRAAVLISGLYDLLPVTQTTVNADIGLTPETARELSPQYHPPSAELPLHLMAGGGETRSWIAQSRTFFEQLQRAGHPVEFDVVGEHDHYSIAAELGDPDSPVTRACMDVVRRY